MSIGRKNWTKVHSINDIIDEKYSKQLVKMKKIRKKRPKIDEIGIKIANNKQIVNSI